MLPAAFSSVRRDSFAAPVFRSARLQTVYCVKQVRHCFLFIASSFSVLLMSVNFIRSDKAHSIARRKNMVSYFGNSMPDRKMRDAGRNRREDPATLIVSRTQYCRGHRFCLCRRWDPHFPVRQKDPFIISCLFFSSGNSLFYPYGKLIFSSI
jgi:hypothetical protein